MSDNKPTGFCFNCDKPLKGRKDKKYCNKQCMNEFWANHDWATFRRKIIKERGEICEDCGAKEGYVKNIMDLQPQEKLPKYITLEVHHIKRIIDGGELCNPDNVVVVCKKCHGIRHRKHKPVIIKQAELF